MKLKTLLLAVLTASTALAANSVPLFNALLTVGKEQRFVLVTVDGQTSSWLKLGDSYAGFTIKAYDPAAATLALERDGKIVNAQLVGGAGVKDAPAAALPATLADAEEVLRVMHFDDMLTKIMAQQKKMVLPMMQQSAARMKIPDEDRERYLAMQKKLMDEMFDSLSGPEMRNNVARIYSETFTKDELSSMSAFYATPAGQAVVAKQPEVQQKMMMAMMPQMQQLGPRMQQMTREFQAEIKARQAAATPPPAVPAAAAPVPGQP